ncbi:Type i inositol polyphosphate 5-phosphatase protein [Thalictrum thalictroides]|uniref:Type i inositol polyphosphate 5-phosphatase protein n=1 Tax=Thalictrum thalictroides TaxID=46969 RepID=A0A7J6WWQ7_THATH|nr:Type i inositol polyphosphate 5-phosphatase protein [Thalictrum thalictroides]
MTLKGDDRRKSFIPKLFATGEKKGRALKEDLYDATVPESQTQTTPSRLEQLNCTGLASPMTSASEIQNFRFFVATWNVGGKAPHNGLNLDKFLRVEEESDIYVLGFQEIVPLNAGNVLVIEDNQPAAKWLALINQALNKPPEQNRSSCSSTPSDYNVSFTSQASSTGPLVSRDSKPSSSKLFFHKPSLKTISKNFRTEERRRLKTCNCVSDLERKNSKDSCFRCQQTYVSEEDSSSEEDDGSNNFVGTNDASFTGANQMKYGLVASKQMVGIFFTIWAKSELVQHVGHMKVSCMGRGIMGYLGNKGCISVSMSFHQTSFCFVCSHLASGEKEGYELRRNYDVVEILKNTQFPRICKVPGRRNPEKILEHDRIIWLGDLNYRIALTYSETRKLLEENDWDALLEKDQLKNEREAGRVFKGWKEGKIYFPPTYKYSNNSDVYAGETITSKKKRRTPAWCDRILWHGDGIEQITYIRGESKFSDHRPVCATFVVAVDTLEGRSKNGSVSSNIKIEELLHPSIRYLEINDLYQSNSQSYVQNNSSSYL